MYGGGIDEAVELIQAHDFHPDRGGGSDPCADGVELQILAGLVLTHAVAGDENADRFGDRVDGEIRLSAPTPHAQERLIKAGRRDPHQSR
mgnify:CR=1 FL=1